jgi:hypothetical protein
MKAGQTYTVSAKQFILEGGASFNPNTHLRTIHIVCKEGRY